MPNWKQAEANDVKAQDDLRRYKALVDKQEVAAQVYDQALAAAKASTASVAAARANEGGGCNKPCSRPAAVWRNPKRTSNPPKPARSKCRRAKPAPAPRSPTCNRNAPPSSRPS